MVEEQVHSPDAVSRIERMERSGLINERQADQLRSGLAAHSRTQSESFDRSQRHRIPIVVAAATLGIIFVILLALVMPSGGTQDEIQQISEVLNEPGTVGLMNKFLSVSIAVFVLVVVPVMILAASYNNLVNKEEAVLTGWSQVESQFQRRADLVPALVETVTRYLQHERETLTEVASQRQLNLGRLSDAVEELTKGQEQLPSADLSDEDLIEDQAALSQLYSGSASVGKNVKGLIAVVEDYPVLASSDQFLELQAQLEGTENRINVARLRFNQAVGAFNSASRRIPGNLAAALGGFKRKAYFRAEEGSDEAEDSIFE